MDNVVPINKYLIHYTDSQGKIRQYKLISNKVYISSSIPLSDYPNIGIFLGSWNDELDGIYSYTLIKDKK
jgi:hypothetical protein